MTNYSKHCLYKAVAFIAAASLFCSSSNGASALRLVGTNLVDFAGLRADTNSIYYVYGEVIGPILSEIHIRRSVGTSFFFQPTGNGLVDGTTLNEVRDVFRRSGPDLATILAKGLNAVQYSQLPRGLSGAFKAVDVQRHFLVSNCPPEFSKPGMKVSFFALPVRNGTNLTASKVYEITSHYNYGTSFQGDPNLFTNYFRVTAEGLIRSRKSATNVPAKVAPN